MPRAKKKRTVAKKFTPVQNKTVGTVPGDAEVPGPAPEVEVATAPEQAKQEVSNDVLTLVSKLTDQIASLTTQVADLSSKQTTIEGEVETYKKESAEQREKSMQGVTKVRIDKKKVMKDKWDSQPTVMMLAPYEGNEKKGVRLHVQANGFAYIHSDGLAGIPKGVYAKIPKGVFDIASESMNQQMENVGIENRVDQRELSATGEKFDPSRLER